MMKSYIKLVGIYVMRFFMRILQIIPIKNNRIIFTSFIGSQYSCNPKYISEYLQNKYPGVFEVVWLMDYPEQYDFLRDKGIKVVKCSYFSRLCYELTAKVSIINAGNLFSWIPLRKGQLHINTWHGGGCYKCVGVSEKRMDTFEKKHYITSASNNTSYYMSSNQCFTDNEIRCDFCYKGEILNIGFPRNDLFFHGNYSEYHHKVCQYFGISDNHRVLLYAPTWKYDGYDTIQVPNFDMIKESAVKKFGGEWVILTRMHHKSNYIYNNPDSYDANYRPGAPDMQELLMASDLLLTDYSSCIWDFSFTYRPCFLFTPDLEEYTKDRGFVIDIHDWGFPVCKTERELCDAIEAFDEETFRQAMEKHHQDLGSFEDGNASEKVGKLIYDFCFPKQDTNL